MAKERDAEARCECARVLEPRGSGSVDSGRGCGRARAPPKPPARDAVPCGGRAVGNAGGYLLVSSLLNCIVRTVAGQLCTYSCAFVFEVINMIFVVV